MDGQIFHDPTGKRRSWVGRILAALILLSIVCFLLFAVTLVFTPNLPGIKAQIRSLRGIVLPNLNRFQRAHELDKIRPEASGRIYLRKIGDEPDYALAARIMAGNKLTRQSK